MILHIYEFHHPFVLLPLDAVLNELLTRFFYIVFTVGCDVIIRNEFVIVINQL